MNGGGLELLATTRALSLGLDSGGAYLLIAKEFNDGKLYRFHLLSKKKETVLTDLLAATPESPERQELRLKTPNGESKLVLPYPEPLWPEGSGPFRLTPDERDLYTVRLSSPSGADLALPKR